MPRAGPRTPVDPHDLRLGVRKVFGWEIIPSALCVVLSVTSAVLMRRFSRETRFISGDVFEVLGDLMAVVGAALFVSTCGSLLREAQARRGVRASWCNSFDLAACLLLVGAVVRAALAGGVETRWVGVVPAAMLGWSVYRLGVRRRRAHAPTPAQRTEATFE